MARLSARRRKKLPKKAFALPSKRKYPIDTRRRAAVALGRVTQFGTAAEKRAVRQAVAKKYKMGPAVRSR
jgi:hypothetical protein